MGASLPNDPMGVKQRRTPWALRARVYCSGSDRDPSRGEPGDVGLSPGKLVAHRETLGRWLGPAVFVLFLILPGPATMPPAAWNTAGIALWMAIWWITEAVPIAVTALLPLALFPSLGILSSADTASNYGNHLMLTAFEGDAGDRELLVVLPYLEWLSKQGSLRPIDKRGWRKWRKPSN